MNNTIRFISAAVVAVIVGFGFMAYDKYTGAEWVVAPQQIEQARANGQTGVETRPGTVAVRAIRREDADMLPVRWAGYGIMAGILILFATRKRKGA